MATKELDVEGEEYYQGLIVNDDLPGILENYGDYVVRTECKPNELPQYVLCINVGREKLEVKEFPILKDGDKYILKGREDQPYEKVVPLINDLIDKRLTIPSDGEVELLRAVKRPSWELKHDQIELNENDVLGSGQFGKVVTGEFTYQGKKIKAAVKVSVNTGQEQDHKNLLATLKEARAMRNVDHPNCIKLYGIVIEKEPVMLVIELVNMGSLLSYLKKEKEVPMTTLERANFALQAAWGLEYLHTKHVIHRDIAARNCLLNKPEGSDKITLKIADFGLSRVGDSYKVSTQGCLPVRYMSPEAIEFSIFDSMTDVWMFGVLMYEIYADGKQVYQGLKLPQVKERVKKGDLQELPAEFPGHAHELITACWSMENTKRPTMHEITHALEKYTKEQAPMAVDPKKVAKAAAAAKKEAAEGKTMKKKKGDKSVDEDDKKEKSGRGKKKKDGEEKSADKSGRGGGKKDGSARSGRVKKLKKTPKAGGKDLTENSAKSGRSVKKSARKTKPGTKRAAKK